jgi:hypothetical protein
MIFFAEKNTLIVLRFATTGEHSEKGFFDEPQHYVWFR